MSILHFKILGLFLSFFSSSESFYFKLPPHLSTTGKNAKMAVLKFAVIWFFM
jgi:hypothetical protein